MKLRYLLPLLLTTLSLQLIPFNKVGALSGSDFKAGRIIDDAVFTNNLSMSVAQIQAFLNSKLPSCDRWHASSNPSYQPPYTCLNEYQENTTTGESNYGRFNGDGTPLQIPGGKSAAQIIFDAGQKYTINPQVLTVLLQKEQSLITDNWPWLIQYQKATGYLCPDTAPCDSSKAGFYRQVDGAAWQFRNDLNGIDTPGFWSPYGKGWNNIRYSPDVSCGTKSVYIENQATAVLYKYTPYTPNQAALDNLYGTGDSCSAYGNRNFWRLFTEWFGGTTGPEYAWSIESLTYNDGTSALTVNQPETITLKARNVGRQPWYNHGDHPIRLGTWLPDRQSQFINNATRFTTLNESVVQPNEVGTFVFTATGHSLGSFIEGMNLVVENYTWMPWSGLSPTLNVTNGYQWQIQNVIYEKGTGVMDPGTSQLITLIAKNTGSKTWSKSNGPPIKLGTWEPGRVSGVGASWPSQVRVTEMNEPSVGPGQTAGFQFLVRMPSSGNYYERLNLVAEGQSWFNDAGLTLYLHGNTISWQPVWWAYSTGGDANLRRGTTLNITVKVKNTGESTWNNTYPIRLGTSAPLNRGSFLYDSSWINAVRPVDLQESSVLPGQQGTLVFKANIAPYATLGPKCERFSMVAEGLAWLNDPGFCLYFNVK